MKQAIISGKLLRLLGAMLLALAAVLCVSINASAEAASNITYLDENGKEQTCESATVVTSSDTTWSSGWYVVNSNVTNDNRIEVSDDVNLILTDGYSLTVGKGITVKSGNTFTIYAQSGGTGKLTAGPADSDYAGIGTNGDAGTITINGGTVTATGGKYGAGIGGGHYGDGGEITISDGNVTAEGGYGGAGIGGGTYHGDGGTITISGGTVTATGGFDGAGIGGGYKGDGGTITISDGTVTATGGDYGAGIGGGYNGSGGTITISDGTVTATGGSKGAGIGGGCSESGSYNGSGGTITISGGTVTATGNDYGAGIGGGYNGGGGTITVSDGDVAATGGFYGAGIGGGYNGGGGTITVSDGDVAATGGFYGAGIGGGDYGDGGEITINGGYFTLSKNSNSPNYIGAGYDGSDGTISITGGYYVNGDVGNQLVYDVSPDTNYYVIPNTDTTTNGTYPYLVSSTIPVFYSSAEAEKAYDGTTAFDGNDIDITFKDINGNEATGVDYTATGNTSSADAGTYTDGLTFEASVGADYILLDTDYSVISTLQKTITASITQKELTISSVTVDGKVYDGTTDVDSSAISSVTFSGLVDGETLTRDTDYTVSAVYEDANVGEQNVIVTVDLRDTEKSKNYSISGAYTAYADITKKEIGFTAAVDNKTYDGERTATVESVTFDGLVASESLTKGTDYTVSAVYDIAEVGTDKDVTVTVELKDSNRSKNYTLSGDTYTAQANITAQGLTFTADVDGKVYDGTTDVDSSAIGNVTFSGLVDGESLERGTDYTVAAEYENVAVGTQNVTVTVALTDTEKSKNYTLSSDTYTAQANITAQGLTFTAEVDGKVYDGTTAVDSSAITNVEFAYGKNEVTLTENVDYTISAVYADANAGEQNVIVTVNLANTNYSLSEDSYTTQANITPKPITIKSSTVSGKVYDGTTDVASSAIAVTFDGVAEGETLVAGTDYIVSAVYEDANVGDDKTVTVTVELKDGDTGKNYTLSNTTYTATSNITAQGLTFTADVSGKVYDGTTAVDSSAITLTFTDGTSEVTLTEGTDYTVSAVYASEEVGTQSVTVTVTLLNSNYALTSYTYTTTATITASDSAVTVTAGSSELTGGGTVTLTVSAPSDVDWSEFTVTCSDSSITVTNNGDGTFTAVLPDESKTYTFTVTYTGSSYTIADTVCTVTVTETAAEEEAVTVCNHVYDSGVKKGMYYVYTCTLCGDTYEVYYANDSQWSASFWGLVHQYGTASSKTSSASTSTSTAVEIEDIEVEESTADVTASSDSAYTKTMTIDATGSYWDQVSLTLGELLGSIDPSTVKSITISASDDFCIGYNNADGWVQTDDDDEFELTDISFEDGVYYLAFVGRIESGTTTITWTINT